ncbi:MAG: hypothetical protein WC052_04745 [Patescibacteria group bacterium]
MNNPRRRRLTAQEWADLFERHWACVLDCQWAHFAAISGCRISTVRARFNQLYPAGRIRQTVSIEKHPLRQTDWTQDEIDTLVELVERGYAPEDIATTMHRTIGACRAKYAQIETGDLPMPATATDLPRWNAVYRTLYKQQQELELIAQKDAAGRSAAGIAQDIGWTVTAVEQALRQLQDKKRSIRA